MRNPPTAMLFRWQHAFSKVQNGTNLRYVSLCE